MWRRWGGGGGNTPLAEKNKPVFSSQFESKSPFSANTSIEITNPKVVKSINYTILTKPDHFAKPVSASFSLAYLEKNGLYNKATNKYEVPVIGLYAGFENTVVLSVVYTDNSQDSETMKTFTLSFTDTNSVYDKINIIKKKAAGEDIGFDFFYLKSGFASTSPVVMDSDGEVRWLIKTQLGNPRSTIFDGNKFIIDSLESNYIAHLDLLGNENKYATEAGVKFHHNIEKGKTGYLMEPDRTVEGESIIESLLWETDEYGLKSKEWDFGKILSDVMVAGGDDPSNFVRNGTGPSNVGKDWFHLNSAIYVPADNSIIVSSRENFVMKIDYDTGALKWLFGDKSKHWYADYPSLQAYAITLNSGNSPIGQHALSIANDGSLMMFNDGAQSFNHPSGTSAGIALTYSAPIAYTINEDQKTAKVSWTFENNQSIFSDICSSAYQSSEGSRLITYSVAYNRTKAKLVGIDKSDKVVFDFELPTTFCNTAWNADFINFESLTFN